MKPERTSATTCPIKKPYPAPLSVARCLVLSVVLPIAVLGNRSAAVSLGGYVGAGIGNASSVFDTLHMGFGQKDLKPDQTAWRLFAGATLNKYIGVEAGYVHLGRPRAHTEPDVRAFQAEVTGVDITPVGTLPVGGGFSVFARAGLIFWHSKMTTTNPSSGIQSSTSSAGNLALGAGAKFGIIRHLAARAEFTRYCVSKFNAGLGDFNFIGVSGLFIF